MPADWIGRVDPGHVAAALGASQRDPNGDPGQPRSERTVATPRGEAPKGRHEGLLGRILGLMEIAEDAMAGPQDGWTFALHEHAECIAIAGQDGIHCGAFIGGLGADGWDRGW